MVQQALTTAEARNEAVKVRNKKAILTLIRTVYWMTKFKVPHYTHVDSLVDQIFDCGGGE